jgi:hypothetical protein
MSTDELIIALRVIASIKEGQKIKLRDNKLTIDENANSTWSAFKRWVNKDNRITTIMFIRNVIDEVVTVNKIGDVKFVTILIECIEGLNNLRKTYKDDQNISNAIEIIKLRVEFEVKNYKRYIDICQTYSNPVEITGSHRSPLCVNTVLTGATEPTQCGSLRVTGSR